jgi:hypothetical protein
MPNPNTEFRIAAEYIRITHPSHGSREGFNEYIFVIANKSGGPINISGMCIKVLPREDEPAIFRIPEALQPMARNSSLEIERERFTGEIRYDREALVQLIKPGATALYDEVLAFTPLRFSTQATSN